MSTGPHEPPRGGSGPARADRRAFLERASTAAARAGLAALSGGLGAVVLGALDPGEPIRGPDAPAPDTPLTVASDGARASPGATPHRPGHDPCLTAMPPHSSR